MAKPTCDARNEPIREGEASLVENTPAATRRWHLECCPLIPQLPRPVGQEDARAAPRPAT